jgi:hypothetical protein
MIHRDFSHIKTHVVRDNRFRMAWRRWRRSPDEVTGGNVGRCDHPNKISCQMNIYPNQEAVDLLETVLHENAHAALPDVEEEAVDEMCQATMRLLRRMKIKVEFL